MSFAPVYDEHSRALILGTWPSPKSREMAFYYGHPQNRFWPMMAALTGEPVPKREDIEAKKQIILRHGLALWDTLESCTITGASDASIRDVVPNDIAALLQKVPIEAVFCNGATAYRIYTKYLQPVTGLAAVKLPRKRRTTMSKIIRTRKPSVLPYYAAALVFVVLCAVLPVYRLWALAAALAAAAAAFLAAKKVCPPRVVETEVPFHTGVEDVDAMLADIQQKLDTLHSLNESLPDPQLSAAMTRMEKAGRSIVEVVEANPAKAKQVRRFANYYLPDAVNVLQQYAQLARQGVRGENAAAIRAEVEHNAASIATAFENQLDALYAAESMDLSADLTVLQNMLKGQGLSK